MTTAVGYSAEVVRRCQQMERAGSWPEDDANVGTGVVGSLASGAMTRLQVRVDAAGARVNDTRFKVFGCSAAIACASLAADRVVGVSVEAARALDADALADALELPDDKRAMAGQAVAAMTAAVEDWVRKNSEQRLAASG
jgi:nitrogen fixation NifU-like protein